MYVAMTVIGSMCMICKMYEHGRYGGDKVGIFNDLLHFVHGNDKFIKFRFNKIVVFQQGCHFVSFYSPLWDEQN